MTFSASTSPDITEGIPLALANARAASQSFINTGTRYDVSIGGIPFFLAASAENPYQRQTAPIQKNQLDISKEAGEQTLDGYWIRSQTSWHRGAGIRYYEPGSDADSEYRFEDSQGVDVWTKDKISLLKRMDQTLAVPAGECAVAGAVVNNADVLFVNANGALKRYTSAGALSATYTGVVSLVGAPALAGGKVLVAHPTGIASGDANGSTLSNLWTQAPGTAPEVYWAKSRVIATRGASIYDLTLAGGNLDTTPALYSHPDTNWTWTSVTEGPSAIYAAGYSNGYSVIYRFFLQDADSGSVPELSQAYQVAELPLGEEVHSIHVALGSFMGIGTSRGLRIALINDQGDLSIGPLLFDSDLPVRAVASGDRFLYATVEAGHPDGNSGAVRVDLSEQIGTGGRWAYAWDARLGSTGTVTSIALLGATTRVAMGLALHGAYLQSDDEYEDEGWLRSGRIRYASVFQKLFRSLTLGSQITQGSIAIYTVDSDDDETYLRTLDAAGGIDGEVGLTGNHEYLRFKFSLRTDAAHLTVTPVMDSMQVRALPFVRRQRLIQYPLLCVDHPETPTGVPFGKDGYAAIQLKGLEAAEEDNVVVTVKDFATDETFDALVEQVAFHRGSNPSADGRKNFGGLILATVRKL